MTLSLRKLIGLVLLTSCYGLDAGTGAAQSNFFQGNFAVKLTVIRR